MSTIAFGEWLPDQPPIGNKGLTVASNCLPYATYYDAAQGLAGYSINTLNGVARGLISTRDSVGNSYTYAGDQSALYRLATSTWYDATRAAGGAYNTANDDFWEFEKWGEQIVATNYTDVIQAITFGQSNFAALAGTPPKARHLAVVRDFLVLGNVTDYSSGASVPNQIHWSAFDNVTSWAPSASTQADKQQLQGDGGWIQKIIGGEYGTIFQERAIWRMTYVGSPIVFQFDKIEPGKGTPAPNSVVPFGNRIFYLGQDDFYIHSGGISTPIGTERIFKTFTDDLDESYYHRIYSVIDPFRPFIFVSYPGAGNTNGIQNRILVYNWAANRWAGPLELTVEMLGILQAEGYTLDGLDAVNASLDSLPYSLDSRYWTGKTLSLVAFDSTHKLSTFGGADLTATFETGEAQIFEGHRSYVTNVRPIIEGGSASVSIALSGRTLPTAAYSFGAAVDVNSDGDAPMDSEGRYHRARVIVKNGFTHAQGIEVAASREGQY